MFVDAIKRITPFTHAFIFSLRRYNGRFGSGCATFIVLNDEGWILTTAHTFKEYLQFNRQDKLNWEAYKAKRREIEGGAQLSWAEAQAQLAALEPSPECITHFAWLTSIPPSPGPTSIDPVYLFEAADLAVGKLQRFDSDSVSNYPVFKSRSYDFPIGSPLCCVGFATAHMPTQFIPETELFDMPHVTLWHFPTSGILTRFQHSPSEPALPRETSMEISCPILPGQSGGPIFDESGFMWGLAQRMAFEDLDENAGKKLDSGEIVSVPQFLKIGRGTHVGNLLEFLENQGVSFQTSG